MFTLSEEEEEQSRYLLVLAYIKSLVSEEDARVTILHASLDKLIQIKQKLQFLDRESELNYLRATAKKFCNNFLQATCKK